MAKNQSGAIVAGLSDLREVLEMEPRLTLQFYDFGIICRRPTDHGMTSHAVDPKEISAALAATVSFETGLLTCSSLYIYEQGLNKVLIEYREPQITAIFLEGSDKPYRIPLPGLVMARTSKSGRLEYRVFAVKERPTAMKTELYVAPLPNVQSTGVCWGSVPQPSKEAQRLMTLEEDWRLFLGSMFNSHGVDNKSLKFKGDVRKMYAHLESEKAKKYPLTDLRKAEMSLGKLIEGLRK